MWSTSPKSAKILDLKKAATLHTTPKAGMLRRFKRSILIPGSAYYDKAPHVVKLGLALLPPSAAWLSFTKWGSQPTSWPIVLASYGRSVGLVGLNDIYRELKKNLGVKLTLTRTYQVFTTIGFALSALSDVRMLTTGVGQVFFSFNLIATLAHAYMLYLTSVYNSRLEESSRYFEGSDNLAERQRISLVALILWVTSVLSTSYIWINEARKSFTSGSIRPDLFAALGFLLISVGYMRAGFRAATSSQPDIKPFVGVMTQALGISMTAASLIPLWPASPIARIYLAGYVSVLYSVFLNGYYAFKKERVPKSKL